MPIQCSGETVHVDWEKPAHCSQDGRGEHGGAGVSPCLWEVGYQGVPKRIGRTEVTNKILS